MYTKGYNRGYILREYVLMHGWGKSISVQIYSWTNVFENSVFSFSFCITRNTSFLFFKWTHVWNIFQDRYAFSIVHEPDFERFWLKLGLFTTRYIGKNIPSNAINMIILSLFAGTKCCNYLYMYVVTMRYLTKNWNLESGSHQPYQMTIWPT